MLQGNTSTQLSKEPVTERMTINHAFVDNLGRLKLIQSVYRLLTSVTAATGLSHIMYNFPLDTAHEKWLMPFNPPRHSVSERYPTWASSITIPRINISFVLHWTEWSRGTLSHLDPLRPRGEINEVKRGALHQDQACRKSELLLTLQCTAMQKQDKLN